jgi:hypothetical protein
MTMEPAMTRISLFASAMVFRASIAASTASSAAVPEDANKHDVCLGMRGDGDEPLRAGQCVRRINGPPTVELGACISQRTRRRHRNRVGNKPADLLDKAGDVFPGSHRDNAKPIGVRGNDRQRALTD